MDILAEYLVTGAPFLGENFILMYDIAQYE